MAAPTHRDPGADPDPDPHRTVRRAGSSDLPALAALVIAFGAEFDDPPDPGVEGRLAATLQDPRAMFLLAGAPPVGFAAVRVRDVYWSARPEAWLEDLYVVPDRRGEGRGRALLEAAIATARERGCGHFELTTTEEDVAAAALYRASGLRETEQDAEGSGRVIWFGLDL